MVDLPEPDRPVNHSTAGCWPFSAARAALSTSSACQWMLVARRRPKCDHAGADRRVGVAVDQDEGAGVAVVAHRDRTRPARRSRFAEADLVERRASVAARCVERVDVDLVLERRDRGGHRVWCRSCIR